ncbi:MAG: SpoIIE family protein phosphatase [Bacteroidota bacterium]|nr:SpoIIE family protein phosphatase [Bacteroidota bacterium]
MRRFNLTFLSILLLFSLGFSQTDEAPEIERNLKNLTGYEEVEALLSLADKYLDYETQKSILYAEIALKKIEGSDTAYLMRSRILNTLGIAYFTAEKYNKAALYFEENLILNSDSGNLKFLAVTEYNMASCYKKMGRKTDAEQFYKQSLTDSRKQNAPGLLLLNYKALFEINKSGRQYFETAKYLEQYVVLNGEEFDEAITDYEILKFDDDIIQNYNNNIQYSNIEPIIHDSQKFTNVKLDQLKLYFDSELAKYKIQLQKAETALNNTKESTNRKINIIYIVALVGAVIAAIWLFVVYRNKYINQKFMEMQKFEIEKQADLLQDKNTRLKESIRYAKRIQDSILIPPEQISKHLPEAFIFYQPKDIVSGDFYWFSKIEDELVLAAIDCTGHGVPGAFMSMIGFSLLNEIVNHKRITKPDKILKHLHLGVLAALQQTDNNNSTDDGMDMSLCTINPKLKRFRFAGAKSHLYVMQDAKLKVLKATHHSVGGRPVRIDKNVEFSSYDFMYDNKTSIYMMSDGYIDQFGGKDNSKFNSDRFKKMLIENRALPMQQQKEVISNKLSEWKGDREQVDDILVMGVKLD